MTVELQVDPPFDLAASLESGQAHRWRKEDDWYSGVVRGNFIKMRQSKHGVEFCSAPTPESTVIPILQNYFRLEEDLNEIYQEIRAEMDHVFDLLTQFALPVTAG